MWLELFKKEVSGKFKQAHIDFLNTLIEILEDEENPIQDTNDTV